MLPAARRTNKPAPKQGKTFLPKWVGLILLLAVLIGLFAVFHSRQKSNTSTQKSPAPASSTTRPQPQPDATLNKIITNWAGQHSFTSSIVAMELTGSLRTASYNQTASIVPASTYKLYVAYAILHGVEQGSYTLATKTSDGNSIQTDLDTMILNSDNDSARTLGFLYGWKNINTLLQSQGMPATNLYNYVPPSTSPVGDKHTTAADLAALLQKLYAGKLLNPANTQLLLGLMERQNYRERIPAGVPSTVAVADKPGWLTGTDDGTTVVENDAAIVYGPKSTYLFVITSTGSTTQPLADLSRLVYNYLEG